MSGKAYTMREMRSIVEYLTQHKAYSEIKGRKMWMGFANSQMTNRTWQSLKETFLKRILPDIHNPYYQLTMEQICSFKQGVDIEERSNKRLEIHTISDDSNNAENENEAHNAQPSTSNNDNEDKTSGENKNVSKISSRNRSSADTYVLENCYDTAEEIQKDLESPNTNEVASKANEVSENVNKSTGKSLRDFITYSEPLTPMLQELLDDFASEDETDREPTLKIVEDVMPDIDSQSVDKPLNAPTDACNVNTIATSENAKHPNPSKSTTVEEPSNEKEDSQQLCTEALFAENNDNDKMENNNDSILNADNSKQVEISVTKDNLPNPKPQENETQTIVINDTEDPIATDADAPLTNPGTLQKAEDIVSNKIENATQISSNTTNDSVLPNNPEAIDKSVISDKQTLEQNGDTDNLPGSEMDGSNASRKRSYSTNKDGPENKKNKQDCVDQVSTVKEIKSATQNSNGNNVNSKDKQLPKVEEKQKVVPSTSNVNKPKATNKKDEVQDEIINPCLQSVSLYAEQFNTSQYIDSDNSDDVANVVTDTPVINKQEESAKNKEVLMLKSHSESETDHIEESVKKPVSDNYASNKGKRDKALANVFGFSTGGVTKSRKRYSSYKKSSSHNYERSTNSFDSSEWTSESDSEEYVSPPRGRKSRHTRKYLKPKSTPVFSLEEEGGLFVINGRKIYPLFKDGKPVKSYLTYSPDSDAEHDESYWKQRYAEQRRKTEELKRLIEQLNRDQTREAQLPSPILQQSTLRNPAINQKLQLVPNTTAKNDEPVSIEPKATKVEQNQDNVKLKFTMNNEEVQLEGQWSKVNPILEEVMKIFRGNTNTRVNDSKSKAQSTSTVARRSTTPTIITPDDPDIHEKIDKIEEEIFKEIEERDKEEHSKTVNVQENNVTVRKAVPERVSASPAPPPKSPAKQKHSPIMKEDKTPVKIAKKRRMTEPENISKAPKRQSKTPKKFSNESPNNETRSLRTRKSNVKETTPSEVVIADNSDVRYMFPPKKNQLKKKLSTNGSDKVNEKKSNKSKENVRTFLSPDNSTRNSIESTQGYQDSDTSPFKDIQIRRKKKLSLSLQFRSRHQFHRNMRRRSTSCLPRLYLSSDSSNSTFSAPVKRFTNEHSTLDSEVYKSQSYQLLLQQPKVCIKRLEIIDEASPTFKLKGQINKKLFNSVNKDINENVTKMNNDTIYSNQGSIEAGSSSNVSLPLSPELSIVENLSLSKDMMSSVADPTLNETQANNIHDLGSYQKYLISYVDISVPLMEQECRLEENQNDREPNTNLNDPKGTRVSKSRLNKKGSVKTIENSTLMHSLDAKLQNLLLESAKKISNPTEDLQNNLMDVDVSNVKSTVKANGKKRCSTPRKKNTIKKQKKPPKTYPVIEEEHMVLCSHGGRKSCPPNIDVRPIEESLINYDETFFQPMNMQTTSAEKPIKKKQKDIIKVKILRPHDKKRTKAIQEKKKSSEDQSKLSVNVDSGINETELGISSTMNDSVDLIHNHSETCLQAHECIGDSVEFIENTSKSIISIDSISMESGENLLQNVYKPFTFNDAEDMPSELLFNNAQDNINFNRETCLDSPGTYFDIPCETVYHSPIATENNSLITEDMSDEGNSQPEEPTKWYLLSDDETNAMGECHQLRNTNFTSSGANLNQLFPIACAVPDLSTITEMSRDNDDNSRKPIFQDEDDTRLDFDSISIFRCKNISTAE